MFCGTTWTKGAIYRWKALDYGLKAIKTALQSTKPLSIATKIVDASATVSSASKLFQKIHNVVGVDTKNVFKNVKLIIDKQNKHIAGKHNFDAKRSLFDHPNPQELLFKHAGLGKPVNKEIPGKAG
jgi:hypothetical protein